MKKPKKITTKEIYQQWINGPRIVLSNDAVIESSPEYSASTIFHTLMYIAISDPKPWHTEEVLTSCTKHALCSEPGGVEVMIRNVKENMRTQMESLQSMTPKAFENNAPKILTQCSKMVDTLDKVLQRYYALSSELIQKKIEHDTSWMYQNAIGMKTSIHDEDLILDVLRKESSHSDAAFDSIEHKIQELFQRRLHTFVEYLMVKNETFAQNPWREVLGVNQSIQSIMLKYARKTPVLNQLVENDRFSPTMTNTDAKNIRTLFSEKSAREWYFAFVNAKKDIAPFPIDHPLQPLNPWILMALCKKGFDYTSELYGLHPLQQEMHHNALACISRIRTHLEVNPVLTPSQIETFDVQYKQLTLNKWSIDQYIGENLNRHSKIEWPIQITHSYNSIESKNSGPQNE